MKILKLELVLLDYDYPQVFIGYDLLGLSYICMVARLNGVEPVYLCVPVSPFRRGEICSGKIDLRQVFSNPEVGEFYWASPDSLEGDISIALASFSTCPQEYLADDGLIFNCEDEVANKAFELRSTVAYASLSVAEARHETRIRSWKLSEFLSIYQNVIKNLSRHAVKQVGKTIPRDETPYNTDVFGVSFGSFTVHLRSSDETDFLGENAVLKMAFDRLNQFIDTVSRPDDALIFLQSVQGHTASALIRLLNFLHENDCPLKHQWASPTMPESRSSTVRLSSARQVIELCRQRADIGVENIEITGIVDSADLSRSTWKIISGSDTMSGHIKPGADINLAGIVIGENYKFKCEEKVEEILGTGKEVKTIHLVSFEKVESSNLV
ncbi:DUF6575 domain-containing protein [Pseudomonas sp. Irchel 3A18]|uniref:DUF6575 domain-containing protein n=1 Tax=Pseudomonas sp. Irchel 3A18 TaxID=2008905 RepID=UPI00117B954C|nr:DUF6575 domain-containing protein [Pseudomonas sp. Irchel 3A18]